MHKKILYDNGSLFLCKHLLLSSAHKLTKCQPLSGFKLIGPLIAMNGVARRLEKLRTSKEDYCIKQ